MAGTVTGGQKAREKNLAKNPNFYKEIGAKGGRNGTGFKGFATNRELASVAGRKGGKISRRGKAWENSTSINLTGKTRQTVAQSSKSSSTSSGGDLDRKTSSFLGRLFHRKENV